MPARQFFTSAQKQAQRGRAHQQSRPVAFHGRDQVRQPLAVVSTDRPLLTTEQVRDRLGLGSVWAVYRLVRERGLPRVDLGGVYRFSPDDLEAWLAARRG